MSENCSENVVFVLATCPFRVTILDCFSDLLRRESTKAKGLKALQQSRVICLGSGCYHRLRWSFGTIIEQELITVYADPKLSGLQIVFDLRSVEIWSAIGQSKRCMKRPSLYMPIKLAA